MHAGYIYICIIAYIESLCSVRYPLLIQLNTCHLVPCSQQLIKAAHEFHRP